MTASALALPMPTRFIAKFKAMPARAKAQTPRAQPPHQNPIDGAEGSMVLLGSLERCSLLLLTIHEQMEAAGQPLARAAWVAYLEASESAEAIGKCFGVEANIR